MYETIAELAELRLVRAANVPAERITITGPEDAAAFLRPHADQSVGETFWLIALDINSGVIGGAPLRLAVGTMDTVACGAGEIVRAAAVARASSVILAHCHPGSTGRGQPEPSDADVHMTRAVTQVMCVAGIPVTDHIILGDDGYTSLATRGVIEEAWSGDHPVSDLVQRGFSEFDAMMAELHKGRGVDTQPILDKIARANAGNRARRGITSDK